jgi:hypothetical protein
MDTIYDHIPNQQWYSEDLFFASNKDMGPKGFIEMASGRFQAIDKG